jgi:adenine C2-methylase RlmN of 23S rRNA A2503 and tRNA A37
MGCTFCATGTLGELGNLSAGEICEQLAHATRDDAVRNVVFMGMGEPLNNYRNVMEAIETMTSDKGFGLSPARITVSTVGVIPRMRTLRRDAPGTRLALSLHAPNQALREKIVPTATAYKLEDLMATLDEHMASGPNVKTMIEYCVLGGVNDDEACARELGALLRGREVIVNLIPLNPTDTPAGHAPPTREAVQKMLEILTSPEFNLFTTVRHEMGQDIAGACGQLALKTPDAPDMEDLIAPQTKTLAAAKKFKSTASSVKSIERAKTSSATSSRGWSRVERALVVAAALSAVALAASVSIKRSRA